jgi:hypothetical protein
VPFLEHPGRNLETLEPGIWNTEPLASIGRNTIDFAYKQQFLLGHKA